MEVSQNKLKICETAIERKRNSNFSGPFFFQNGNVPKGCEKVWICKKIIYKSKDGLVKRNIQSEKGNESTFLEPLKKILESGKSPAEMWKKLFYSEWNNDIDMLYETNYFKVLENEKI